MQSLLFPRGLPGFEQLRWFRLGSPDHLQPLLHLESAEVALRFLLAPVELIEPDYQVALNPEEQSILGFKPDQEVSAVVLAVLSLPEGGKATANLLAPIVANLANGIAVQAVRDDMRYSHQHEIPLRASAQKGTTAC